MLNNILNELGGADSAKAQILGKQVAVDIAKRFNIVCSEYKDLLDAEKRFDEETKIIDEQIDFDRLSPEEIESTTDALSGCFDKISSFWVKVTNTIWAAKEADALVCEILTLVSSEQANKDFNESLGKNIKEIAQKLDGDAKIELSDCGDKILEFSKNRQNGVAALTNNYFFVFKNDQLIIKHIIKGNPIEKVQELLSKHAGDIDKVLLWNKLYEQKNKIKDWKVEKFSF